MTIESRLMKIDETIAKKLEERMRTVEGIAQFKKDNELPVLDAMREKEKIDKITDLVSDDMASYTRLLYNTIMEMSKDHQRKINQVESPVVKSIKQAMEETPKVFPARASVACQGVIGAYSQEACEKMSKAEDYVREELQRRFCSHR